MPRIYKLTETRKKHISARIDENGIDSLFKAFEKAGSSDFLTGKTPNKSPKHCNFKCDIDWIINQNNFVKILEGKYDNKAKTNNIKNLIDLSDFTSLTDNFLRLRR